MDSINIRYYFFYLAALVVIIAGLKVAGEIVIILFLAIFIASIFSSLLNFLEKHHIPKILSYAIVISIFLLIFILLGYIVNNSLKSFIENIPEYEKQLEHLVIQTIALGEDYGIIVDKQMILDTLNFGSFFGFTTNIIGSIGTFLSKFLLVVIGVAFILAESKSFERKLKVIFKQKSEELEHFNQFSKNIQKYFLVKSTTSFLTGFIISIGLMYFNVDYPILWGVIAILFNFVPVVGSIVAAIPAVLLAMVSLDFNTVLFVITFYVVINISISNIIEPKLMGKELGLSPMIIFFSLILWGWVLGIVGMFLAVPITMTLKIAFSSNNTTQWLSVLMSDVTSKKNMKG